MIRAGYIKVVTTFVADFDLWNERLIEFGNVKDTVHWFMFDYHFQYTEHSIETAMHEDSDFDGWEYDTYGDPEIDKISFTGAMGQSIFLTVYFYCDVFIKSKENDDA